MRRYVRKEDLIATLNELTAKQDAHLVQVYKDVMMYRFSKNKKKYAYVENMLFMPRRIVLVLLNTFLALLALYLLPEFLIRFESTAFRLACLSSIYIFLGLEAWKACQLFKMVDTFAPYIIVDELIARKIIVLSSKKSSPSSNANAKAAK